MELNADLSELFFGQKSFFDFEKEKKKLIDDLDNLKSMSVEEFTFYNKYRELQLDGAKKLLYDCGSIKSKIWAPIDINNEKLTIDELKRVEPKIILVDNESLEKDWNSLRYFSHSANYNQSPGRFLRFLIINSADETILGFISIASDVITIKDRDDYIGWSHIQRIEKSGKLNNSAIGTTIAPTQPFGYNFLGGKLIACLITSKVIREFWRKIYNDVLVGMTTTSLYGSYSMYNNLKWWHKCGTSKGKILIKPSDDIYKIWHDWVKKNKSEEYIKVMTQKEGISGPVTGAKLRVLGMIFDSCNIRQSNYYHCHERGTYYSCFYENAKDFLCGKIEESDLKLKLLFEDDTKNILEWWRSKAISRYKKLKNEKRLKPEKLFYNNMIGMSYEDAKKKYFQDIGR